MTDKKNNKIKPVMLLLAVLVVAAGFYHFNKRPHRNLARNPAGSISNPTIEKHDRLLRSAYYLKQCKNCNCVEKVYTYVTNPSKYESLVPNYFGQVDLIPVGYYKSSDDGYYKSSMGERLWGAEDYSGGVDTNYYGAQGESPEFGSTEYYSRYKDLIESDFKRLEDTLWSDDFACDSQEFRKKYVELIDQAKKFMGVETKTKKFKKETQSQGDGDHQ